jgi:hypothetical protein
MPDIRESIQIDAPAAKVSPLVSSGEGFSKWWAEDVVLRPESVDLGFFNRATVYSVQLVRPRLPTPNGFAKAARSGKARGCGFS